MFGKSKRQIAEEAQAKQRREEAAQPKVFNTTNIPVPYSSNSDREMIRRDRDAAETAKDTLQQGATHDSGWIINPDRISTTYKPGKFAAAAAAIQDAAKVDWAQEYADWMQNIRPQTIADQQSRQAADWAAIIALTEAEETGTLKESLDAAISNYRGRSIRSAMVEALADFGNNGGAVLLEYDLGSGDITLLDIDEQGVAR